MAKLPDGGMGLRLLRGLGLRWDLLGLGLRWDLLGLGWDLQ